MVSAWRWAAIPSGPDGTAHLLVGVTDIGTGAKTTVAIIAAEALGIPLEQVEVTNGDTDVTPYSVGESGSRTTPVTGPAVIAAAEERGGKFSRARRAVKSKYRRVGSARWPGFCEGQSFSTDCSETTASEGGRGIWPGGHHKSVL